MFVMLLVFFIDLLGFSIIFPLFPLLQNVYGFTPANVAYVAVSFSFFMIIGSLVFGILSDKYGRKYMLALPLVGAALAYLWTSQAETMAHFLLGRALSGFFSGCYSVGFAIGADLSTKETRIRNMSMLGALFGLSFVIGPILGGNLHIILPYIFGSSIYGSSDLTRVASERIMAEIPFIFSAVLSFIASLLTLLFFKETFKPRQHSNNLDTSVNHIVKEFISSYSQAKLLVPTCMSMILTAIVSGLQVFLGIWMANIFKISTEELGYFWSITAMLMIITQMIIRSFFYKISPIKINILAWMGLALGLIVMSFTSSFTDLCISAIIFYIALSFLQSSLSTSVSLGGTDNQQGLVFGINQAISGLGRIIGPNLVGMIITMTNSYTTVWLYLGIVAIIMSAIAMIFAVKQKLINIGN